MIDEPTVNPVSPATSWDGLHSTERFRPVHPSEPVVRFLARTVRSVRPRARMVDVGCGAGRHLLLAAMGGASVVGVDLSIEGLREAAKRLRAGGHGVALVRASMSDLALQRESADVMVAYGSLYYSDESSYQAAVAELWRVLRAEGHALVVTRTTRDSRFSLGEQLEPRTVRITSAVTNERGMIMHFLDRPAIDDIFSGFSKVTVDWVEHTSGGGTVLNSDWVIELKK